MLKRFFRTVASSSDGEYLADFTSPGDVVQRAWAAHTAVMSVADSHPIVAKLMADPGPRAEVWMITIDEEKGTLDRERVCSGMILGLTATDSPYGTVSINVADDKSLLDMILGWQVPTAPLTGQSAAEYARYTGPTETRVKAAIQANATRLALPWDIVPTRGKGTTGVLELRMHDLTRKTMPILEADRLILTVERQPNGRTTVDIIEGDTLPRPLTPLSGVMRSWGWVYNWTTATRAIIGGRGEGTAREFVQVTDTAAETATGIPLEVFVDARQTDEGTDITPTGWDALAERAATAGFTPALRETGWFTFPDAYRIGTRVPVQVGALELDDVVTQIVISDEKDKGFTVTPTVGLATADPQEQLLEMVKKLTAQVRGLERQ